MARDISVLHVEDEPDFADLVSSYLLREDDRFDIRTATDPGKGLKILSQHNIDCVVSDYDMPGQNGIEFLKTVRETYPKLPFILYTGKGSEEIASDAISAGVTDYLQKQGGSSQYTVLANRIINSVESYRAQTELGRARSRFQMIFEASNDAIFVLDPEDEAIIDANPKAESLLGYTREELLSSVQLSDIHPNDLDQYREFLDLVQSDELGRRGDFQCVTKEGEPKECEISVSSREFEEDRYIIATIRDISDRKDYEKRLEQFASVVSHDLRNPLNVADGRLELAQDECDSEHLDGVENAHERMRSMIDDLLNLVRDGESFTDKEPVGLSTVVDECWETVKTDESRLNTTLDGTILADKTRVRQMFENLFRNAVEHGGDDVTVTVGELHDGFFVEDDGPGINPSDRQVVFETGYSTTDDGTGLGLSIVKEVAETHDWQIRVTDGSEGGARFEITGVKVTAE